MNTTAFKKLLWLALCGAGVMSAIQACSDDETTSTSSSGPTTAPASSSSGMTNCMSAGFDPACEMCVISSCMTEAQGCADESTCNAAGEPTGGCLSLVACAASKCGGADQLCVAQMCAMELESAGGINGPGTAAARALGDCVTAQCDMECSQGGAGGTGSGGAGGS